eukprot:CAMPEP_0194272460 /NCGR_PEP_ID=MMETSP0169-20130528/6023_1 /TAXON_ID=218684 /ORGANISM="Corethron pennatum, Strain L29A3" /LENGTH=1067 /DNA_ID=CAMNT_0039015129 /DNA_START=29 /DNA_END=3232 /DNA_ORIENTATION=-
MARGKNKKGRRGAGDSSDDEAATPAAELPKTEKALTKRQRQKLAQQEKQQQNQQQQEDDGASAGVGSSTGDASVAGVGGNKKKLTKKQLAIQRELEREEEERRKEEESAKLLQESASEEEMHPSPPPKKLSNKQLKKMKQKQKIVFNSDDEDEDEDPAKESECEEESEPAKPVKKMSKKQLKKQKQKLVAEVQDSEEEVDEPLKPVKKLSKKQLKKQKMKQQMVEDSEDEENESEEKPDDDDEVDNNMPSVGKAHAKSFGTINLLMDEDSSSNEEDNNDAKEKKKKEKKKEKKDKKHKNKEGDDDAGDNEEKKHKKEKKEKKKKKKSEDNNEDENDNPDDEEKIRKKKDKKDKKKDKKDKKDKKKKSSENVSDDEAKQEANEGKENEDDDDVFYGAPDDAAWTDKSAAILLAEKMANEAPDKDELMYGPDGKKLSNKERKKKMKQIEQQKRELEYEVAAAKASAEGSQFACSQTIVDEKDQMWMNSLDINVPSFNISAAGKVLFKDASLSIVHGRRYGLVGPNGRGKSTLLKMIASRDLKLPPRVDFLYVEQEVVADDTPAVDAVLKADSVRWNLLEEERNLSAALDAGDENENSITRLQEIYEQLSAIGSDTAESKARKILYGLGFDIEMQTKPTKMFSGGWRMRISLARALFIEPTLLMLDEPTNHLDLNAVIWLDDYLQKWKKTLFIVSHDQDFLNSVTEEILHIEDLKLASYRGNYDSFKKLEIQKRKQLEVAWEKQEKRLRELKRKGHSKAKAMEAVKKNQKREPTGKAKKKQDDAIASGHMTAEIKELIKRPREYAVQLEFSDVQSLNRPVIEVSEVHFRYGPKYPVIFDRVDFGIDMDSRICVVGPNGAGKSTLLKLLTGEIEATSGDLRRNPRLRMGIYNQHFVDRLPMSKTPVEHLRDSFEDEDYQSVRNRLGKYGLEGHAHEVCMRDLSGGQKARVVFVELSLQCPHVLLLDEPTNNLDIETIDALCDAINEFNGGIVVVTHDARLIEDCDLDLWVVEKQGVTKWTAGFEDYKTTLLEEMEAAMEKEAEERAVKLAAAADLRALKIAAKLEALNISK